MTSPGSSTRCFASCMFLPDVQVKIFFLGIINIPIMFLLLLHVWLGPFPSSFSQIWCRGTKSANFQQTPWEQSSRTGTEQSAGENDHVSFRLKAYQKAGWGPGHWHLQCRCVCVCLGWLAPMGTLQPCCVKQDMCPHPRYLFAGDANGVVHKHCSRCLVG